MKSQPNLSTALVSRTSETTDDDWIDLLRELHLPCDGAKSNKVVKYHKIDEDNVRTMVEDAHCRFVILTQSFMTALPLNSLED